MKIQEALALPEALQLQWYRNLSEAEQKQVQTELQSLWTAWQTAIQPVWTLVQDAANAASFMSENDETKLVKVSAHSKPSKVAGSIAYFIRQGFDVSVQTVGQPALLVATHAILIATRFMSQDGFTLMSVMREVKIELGGHEVEGVRYDLDIELRSYDDSRKFSNDN